MKSLHGVKLPTYDLQPPAAFILQWTHCPASALDITLSTSLERHDQNKAVTSESRLSKFKWTPLGALSFISAQSIAGSSVSALIINFRGGRGTAHRPFVPSFEEGLPTK